MRVWEHFSYFWIARNRLIFNMSGVKYWKAEKLEAYTTLLFWKISLLREDERIKSSSVRKKEFRFMRKLQCLGTHPRHAKF